MDLRLTFGDGHTNSTFLNAHVLPVVEVVGMAVALVLKKLVRKATRMCHRTFPKFGMKKSNILPYVYIVLETNLKGDKLNARFCHLDRRT